jgi:hypothetical protein
MSTNHEPDGLDLMHIPGAIQGDGTATGRTFYSDPASELDLASEVTRTGHDAWVVGEDTYQSWDAARNAAHAAVYRGRADRLEKNTNTLEAAGETTIQFGLDTLTIGQVRGEVTQLRRRAAAYAAAAAYGRD